MFFEKIHVNRLFNGKPTRKHAIRIANALKSFQLAIRSLSYDLGGSKKIPSGHFKGTKDAPS